MNSTQRATQRTDHGIVETFHEQSEAEAKLFADALATSLGITAAKVIVDRLPDEAQHWIHVRLPHGGALVANAARLFALGWNARKEYELGQREREQDRARAIALGQDPDAPKGES